jgi:hypothetical protein
MRRDGCLCRTGCVAVGFCAPLPSSTIRRFSTLLAAAEEIRGLDTLLGLRELDLSFNRIRRIDGLGKLAALTDLSLYSNAISEIGGLEAQAESVETLSLGRNPLAHHRQLLSLRSCRKLRVLCLEGSLRTLPQPEYRSTVLAVMPQLRYLDWSLVTDSERKGAAEGQHRVLVELQLQAGLPPVGLGAAPEGGPGHHGQGTGADSDHAHAALSVGGAAGGGGRSNGWMEVGAGGSSEGAEDAAALQEAGLQFVAYCWRIMNDPASVSDIAGLGQGAGAAAAKAALQQRAASALAAAASPAAGGGEAPSAGGLTSRGRGGGAAEQGAAAAGASSAASDAANDRLVLRIPGLRERVEALRETVSLAAEQAVTRGLATHSDQQREVTAAAYVLAAYLEASDAQAKALLTAFASKRKRWIRATGADLAGAGAPRAEDRGPGGLPGEGASPPSLGGPRGRGDAVSVSESSELAMAEAMLRTLTALAEENEALQAQLLGVETVLHEQCMAVLTELDGAYAEVAAKRADLFSKFYRSVEKEALAVADDAKAVAMAAVDAYQEHLAVVAAAAAGGPHAAAGGAGVSGRSLAGSGASSPGAAAPSEGSSSLSDPALEVEEEVAALLGDRESVSTAVSNAFDQRVARVLAAEDKTRLNERERERRSVKLRIVEEADRHRQRMSEIQATYARNKGDIEALIAVEHHTLQEYQGE